MVLVTMMIFALTGCGSSKTAATAETAAESSAEEKAAGSVSVTVDEIKERGKLVIGGEMNYEPYEFLDENDEYIGYDIEIWKYIANDMGVDLEIIDLPFSGALTGLDAGKYDVVGCVVGVNAERAKSYEFSIPIMQTRYMALKAAGNDAVTSSDNLGGFSIGSQTGSNAEVRVNALAEELEKNGTPFSEVKSYSGTADAFMDVANGGIDVAVEAEDMTKQLMINQPGVFEEIGTVGENAYLSYAFRLSDTEFRDFVDEEIKKMKADGTLSELMTKYFGNDIVGDLPETDWIPQ